MEVLGQIGIALVLGLGALGSAAGIGSAGMAAAGAWAKEAKAGMSLRFTYIILMGLPTSQTLYAMILMNKMAGLLESPEIMAANAGLLLSIGLAGGLGELFSAWMQGRIGASAVRCMSESEGKGFAFMLIAMAIAETIGILTVVFLIGVLPG